jgi:cytochrome c oxidase cbb3-type subunit 3
MAVEEQDPHTGFTTTGHEWNGIKELNTPVPRPVYFFLIATFIFSVGYWLLMPAWPTGADHTKGLLGFDDRGRLAETLKKAALDRASWTQRIAAEPGTQVQADAGLMKIVRQTGHALYGDNCAVCHGTDAKGGKGFPDLTTSSWLWGGDPATIAETIRVGINSSHAESRVSQMLAFGRDGMLPAADINNLTAYVRSLSGHEAPAGAIAAGKAAFAANCVSCHGDDAKGKTDVGAPDLTDASWIYGGDVQSVFASIWAGRQGHMPSWEGRLSEVDRKVLALYLADLKAGVR